MKKEVFNLWEITPGICQEPPKITVYIPDKKECDDAVVILPGGAYSGRAPHEGEGYALFLAEHGITAFVCDYRVSPLRFPLPLLDARRAVRFVRANAEKYGIDKDMVYIMGSSAGGHLAALTCTYREPLEFEDFDDIDKESSMPNGQILCYPVIKLLGKGVGHICCGLNLLGNKLAEMGEDLSPDLIADENTPRAFIWHTFDDNDVNVINSLDYAKRLRMVGVDTEMHIFPNGTHGLGLAPGNPYVGRWGELLIQWLAYNRRYKRK